MTYNQVLLSGEINNILINNKYITLGLTCKKYFHLMKIAA